MKTPATLRSRMSSLSRVLSLLTLLLLLSATLKAQNKKFVGSWVATESSVQYNITLENGEMNVEAIDNSDGEVLQTSNLRYPDKKTMRLTLHTPSTDHTVTLIFVLKGKGEFLETIAGNDTYKAVYTLK